ncbi:MAG: hypothetical protein DHS80DRAFT_26223 [Piptocephalis tieghemiana]|nr:MAG: hypothetical protein DHS80DRAFT_26223 [Piptocephalis tieghemiana]
MKQVPFDHAWAYEIPSSLTLSQTWRKDNASGGEKVYASRTIVNPPYELSRKYHFSPWANLQMIPRFFLLFLPSPPLPLLLLSVLPLLLSSLYTMSTLDSLNIPGLGERLLPSPTSIPPQIQSFLPTVTSLVPTTASSVVTVTATHSTTSSPSFTPLPKVTSQGNTGSSGSNRALIIVLSCIVAALLLLIIIFAVHRHRHRHHRSRRNTISSRSISSIEDSQGSSDLTSPSNPRSIPQRRAHQGTRPPAIDATQGRDQQGNVSPSRTLPPHVPVPVHSHTYPRAHQGQNQPQETLEVDIRDPVPMYTRRSKTLWRGSGGRPRREEEPERSEGTSTPPLYGSHQEHSLIQSSPTVTTTASSAPPASSSS